LDIVAETKNWVSSAVLKMHEVLCIQKSVPMKKISSPYMKVVFYSNTPITSG